MLLIPALLIGAGLVDQAAHRPTSGSAVAEQQPVAGLPVAFPQRSVGTAWYCAGGTATAGGAADHVIFLFNPAATPATATVTAYPSAGSPKTTTLVVKPRFRASVRLSQLVDAPYAAAAVESNGSQLVVQQQVSGPLGYDLSPCANQASTTWYAPGGSTAFGNDEVLAILNPYGADATVNIAFVTDSADLDARSRQPHAFQGMAVPGRSLVIARITDQVSRQNQVTATVTATNGAVVVDQLQAYGGDLVPPAKPATDNTVTVAKPAPGITVHPAVPVAATTWAFPDGRKGDGQAESVLIFNPSGKEANVEVSVIADAPAGGAAEPIAPFGITGLAPDEFQVIDISQESRVPRDVGHSFIVKSTNGVAVVAQRLLLGASPWGHAGASAVTGSPIAATTWLMPTGSAVPTITQDIVLFNPGEAPATARATFTDSGKVLGSKVPAVVTVAPGGRAVIAVPSLGLPAGDMATTITADRPVVVEQAVLRNGTLGIAGTIAIPRPEGIRPLS